MDLRSRRETMVDRQVAARGVRDPAVLRAMREVPREAFLPEELEEFAYEDSPLPIEAGQTISQPYIVALMTQALRPEPRDRVLEVGTGSGYAAAVLSRVVERVYTIERHAELAELAADRLEELGYDNAEVRHGDGTLGWPEAAPFDGIVVAAGGPEVPEPLLDQLALGGRLVIPIGPSPRLQELVRVTRLGEDEYRRERLGGVRFVPLVGARGWAEAAPEPAPEAEPARPGRPAVVAELVAEAAEPFGSIAGAELGPLIERIGDARVVLLGEATHGTSEFYRMRARITRELVQRRGFTIVAVEADWPDAARIDAWVRHRPRREDAPPAFTRFPTWMWRNREVERFGAWLRDWNADVEEPIRRVGFYGLDLYSLYASIEAVLGYLDRVDPDAARIARERYGCLSPWESDPARYGRAALTPGFRGCEREAVATLRGLLERRLDYLAEEDGEAFLDAVQNARLVANAERYYRVMYYGAAESWNLRDRHMFDTLRLLLDFRPDARAVVWEHNSHVGDAAATEMGARGQTNVGELCRDAFGERSFRVGFGTDRGEVVAASEWGGPAEVKAIRPALDESYERLCRDTGIEAFLLHLREPARGEVVDELSTPRLERAIGVIYRPETELESHYFHAVLPFQFDEWIWFEETGPVTPLPAPPGEGLPETYPFGV